ncbi:MAG: tyrosine-type recombinase/integrase [Streptosporangiaceae bacterium]|jgi:site-specific recombinase XerD|nr:transposase [Actinomycetota bacterium]
MGVQRVVADGERTWTVVGEDHLPAGPAEEYLEFLRVAQRASPNTVRSYAASLSRWWDYLTAAGLSWDEVTLPSFTPFLTVLRTGDPPGVSRLPAGAGGQMAAESTVAARVTAVLSFYRYHADVHQVPVAGRLYRVSTRGGSYVPGLAHLQRGRDQLRPAVRLRRHACRPVPLLTPLQVEAILDGCARWDAACGEWTGSVRDRLMFATLAETGMRLGECLSTRHCDWHAGRGGTPFIEVVPRQDHPAGARVKNSRYRRIHISDELERLHSEYLWQLCDAGAHQALDLENHFVFVNLCRGRWLAPLRPETVYDLVATLKRRLGSAVPDGWTPHWFRHTHASALLLSGAREHVVMRRLGHADIQTTLSLYGWVSEDAELAALAGWRRFCAGWDGRQGSSGE